MKTTVIATAGTFSPRLVWAKEENPSVEKWPIGIFAGIDPSQEFRLEVAHDLGIPTIQLYPPAKELRTPENAQAFLTKLNHLGIQITCVFLGFEGDNYETIASAAETLGFAPKATRDARMQEAKEIADFAKLLGVDAIGGHANFAPRDTHPVEYEEMVETFRSYCDYLKRNGQRLHIETGQETADDLLTFIRDVKTDNLFINFDPANMIDYGKGNPIESLKKVGSYVRSVHCKDALATQGTPGVDWGKEVPFGTGEVNAEKFLTTLQEVGYNGPLTIECEIPLDPEKQKAELIRTINLIRSIKDQLFVS